MVYFFNLVTFIFSVFKCFFSKQFLVRSYHENLVSRPRFDNLTAAIWAAIFDFCLKVHDRQSLLNQWTSNVKRGKKLGKECHKE